MLLLLSIPFIMISRKDTISASSDLMIAELEGEAVLLDMQSGRYFGLNEVGTQIWEMAQEPCLVEEVIMALEGYYEIPASQLEQDVMAFLHDMMSRQLIVVSSVVEI